MKKFGQLLGIAASIATVLGLIITIAALSSRGSQSPGALAAGTAVLSSSGNSTSTPEPSATPVPTSTPATRTITKNLAIPYAGSGGGYAQPYPALTVELVNITTDPTKSEMLWDFRVRNTGSENCASTGFYDGSPKLQAPDGTVIRAQGQASNSFSLPADQSIDVFAMYPLAPPSGTTFTVSTTIYVGDCNSNHWPDGANNYQTIQVTV